MNFILEFTWYYIVLFLFVLTVLVYVHEWGHYWVARKNGVRVEVFSIGFGPEVYGWTRSEEHTSELQSRRNLVCRLLLEKKKQT